MLKDLELERANHSATPCAVERKNEGDARSDESAEENRRRQGQTQTKHEWDGLSGDDKDRRWQVTTHSQTSLSTELSSHESATCHKTGPDLKIASMQVCCAMASSSVRDMERVKRIGRYLTGELTAVCLFLWQQKSELWRRIRTPIGVVTERLDLQRRVERRTLLESVDQEAASGVMVHC